MCPDRVLFYCITFPYWCRYMFIAMLAISSFMYLIFTLTPPTIPLFFQLALALVLLCITLNSNENTSLFQSTFSIPDSDRPFIWMDTLENLHLRNTTMNTLKFPHVNMDVPFAFKSPTQIAMIKSQVRIRTRWNKMFCLNLLVRIEVQLYLGIASENRNPIELSFPSEDTRAIFIIISTQQSRCV